MTDGILMKPLGRREASVARPGRRGRIGTRGRAARLIERGRLLSDRTGKCAVASMTMAALRWIIMAGWLVPASALAQGAALPSPHLAVGDRVIVRVWPEIKLSDTAVVDERGEINLPHVGSIGVLTFDYEQLRDTLRARYATFLRSPVIDVIAFRRVTVNGAVGKPDIYMIDLTSTIRDVIARAGGVAPYGDSQKVSILRGDRTIPAPNWDQPGTAAEFPLQSGDVILVGRRPWWVENLGTITGVAGLAASLAFALFKK